MNFLVGSSDGEDSMQSVSRSEVWQHYLVAMIRTADRTTLILPSNWSVSTAMKNGKYQGGRFDLRCHFHARE